MPFLRVSLFAVAVTLVATPTTLAQTFTDVATALGWPNSSDATRGMGWADYDQDGDPDVYLQNQGSTSRLLRNDGAAFTNVTTAMAVSHASSGWSCAWGDYDADGRPDLYLGNFQGNNLFRNTFPAPFTDVSPTNGTADATFAQSVVWVDHDRDGDLDLYLTKELDPHRFFQNQGDGSFLDITAQTGLSDPQSHSYGVSFGDFDQDGDPDVYVSTCGTGVINRLFRNETANGGGLLYTEIGAAAAVNVAPNHYGTEWVDLDDDGDLDLFVVGASGAPNKLFRNDGVLPMLDVAIAAGVAGPALSGHGCDIGDFDNDGKQDLFVHDRAGPSRLYRNIGNLFFIEVANANGASNATGGGYDASFVDYDNDGDLDLHVATDARDRLYRNNGTANRWLQVVPVGTRDNRSAIGVKIEVSAGTTTQHRTYCNSAGAFSQNLLPAHFGMGAALVATQITVRWLDGTVDVLTNVPTNQRVTIIQSSGRAAVSPAGPGCANAALQVPVLAAVGLPVLGSTTFALTVQNAPPSVPMAIFLSTSLAAAPFDLGNGCLLHLDLAGLLLLQQLGVNPLFTGQTGPLGTYGSPLPLPASHALAGATIPLQAALLDPTAPPIPGSPVRVTLSNALTLRLGY